jgi:hypothetical protein
MDAIGKVVRIPGNFQFPVDKYNSLERSDLADHFVVTAVPLVIHPPS